MECTLVPPGEYDWTMHVRWWCGLTLNYFDHLFHFNQFKTHVWQKIGFCQQKHNTTSSKSAIFSAATTKLSTGTEPSICLTLATNLRSFQNMSTNRETSYMKRFLQHKKNNKLTMDHDSFIMAALCNRGGGIIFVPCSFFPSSFYLLLFFFPRLISAAVDRMSAILLHMAWP